MVKMNIMDQSHMNALSPRDAKKHFDYLIYVARQEAVSVEKHGRSVVVVLSIENYERLAESSITDSKEGAE